MHDLKLLSGASIEFAGRAPACGSDSALWSAG